MKFLSIHIGHNATVILSMDGKIITAISEERITRIKNVIGFPINAIKFIKSKYLNNDLSKIDKFVFIDKLGHDLTYLKKYNFKQHQFGNYGWKNKEKFFNYRKFYELLGSKSSNILTKFKRGIFKVNLNLEKKLNILDEIFKIYPEINFDKKKAVFYDHHEMHALSHRFFINTDSRKNLIFTMDGEGDNQSSTVSIFEKGQIKKISENSRDFSIGYLYAETTNFLGMKQFQHEFKVMGMAPYSQKNHVNRIKKNLEKLVYLRNDGKFDSLIVSSLFKYELEKIFKFEKFENICGAIQAYTEELIIKWINYWINKTSINNIIVSGGVFMNIKAIKEVSKISNLKTLYAVPSSSDESLPFGALFKVNKIHNQDINLVKNLYLGTSSKDNLDSFLDKIDKKQFKIETYSNFQEINQKVSRLLSENNIVARCVGKEEWGARALGNRSILCNPSNIQNIKIINSAVKQRDYWMPFSPSILDEDAGKYFFNPKNIETKFMTCLFDSTELAKKHLVAAIHPIDNTMRPQVVLKEDNEEYYDLIKQFKKLTGIGALLNTSFNLHGEPNVSCYEDAIHTLKGSKLKFLLLENYLIEKNDNIY